jgi:uncharacterized membrane protein
VHAKGVIRMSSAQGGISAEEIAQGKVLAIVGYIVGLVAIIVLLAVRNNAFALYHAKQSVMIFLTSLALCVVVAVLMFVPVLGTIAPVVLLAVLVLAIMGVINAAKGEMKPLPLIGAMGESMFASFQKK